METDPRNIYDHHHLHGLEPGFYTAEKLRYASARHVHMTSRRYFIGPIPKGWLQNHRKSWYRARLNFKNYSSKTVTFSAEPEIAHYPDSPDRGEPSDSQREQDDDYPVDTTEGETTDLDLDLDPENETTDQDSIQGHGALRALDYPLDEENELPPALGPNTQARPDSGKSENNVGAGSRMGEAGSSFVTARERGPSSASTTKPMSSAGPSGTGDQEQPLLKPSAPDSNADEASQSSPMVLPSEVGSETPLLRPDSSAKGKGKARLSKAPSSMNLEQQEPQSESTEGEEHLEGRRHSSQNPLNKISNKAAKYNLDDNLLDKQQRFQSRLSRTRGKISSKVPYRRKLQDGEIIKTERMLVRVEQTMQDNLPHDFSEHDSMRMETRVLDNWREYLVVCRATADPDAPFSLQMYKTHVIPKIQKKGSRVSPHHEVILGPKKTRVNLYSSLDKSIVIWGPCKYGTKIYIIRPKSTAHAVEWYTSIFQALGWQRPTSLSINVPDLGVGLVFRNPFDEQQIRAGHKTRKNEVLARCAEEEKYAATAIVRECIEMLEKRAEWADVLQRWSKTEKMGLAWKRYDRLEWIYGINEEKMYGSLAMQNTHELELRPRQHYHTFVPVGDTKIEEPEPVEGFLVRLTSQKGAQQRMNKMFFKRLYFFCQDHYLFFCRPAKSLPPAPPRLCRNDSNIPSTQDILDEMPLSYDIDPYPYEDGNITWLTNGNKEHIKKHDEEAYAQLRRVHHNLNNSDGYIDLRRVVEARHVRRDSCPADPNIREGPDVPFNPEARDTRTDDGATQQFEDDRTFEMQMDNGLVVRLQAYNVATKDDWIKRLNALVRYWKTRAAADAAEIKDIRRRNVDVLGIDAELESMIGLIAKKWEVKKAEASPHLHNMCSLCGCRAIKMSGQLFKKPRRHSTFKRSDVVLADGKLLIFRSSLRKRNGVEIPHIHSSIETTIDLTDCYIYSGLLAESDLLYSNQTFDSNNPGHRTLPRAYLSTDVYTSTDEDTAITFVIWQPLRKNLFRAIEGKRGQTRKTLKQVPKLGVHGRTVVFKARSRVEKDRWVLSIASEIDRLQEHKPEDIRLV
ncbi:sporulation-specific 71 family protein [Aspergillus affinis]|uniref:sporulation-specific 71 family protein n=1 Tax=Aspergillus affinis TaxID=1070780 RepID=UPI0022FE9734|nr:PH domain protein [Aspergillus affinis]KAI9037525.1 PH domain protein [Aspergillus affinis]